MDGLFYNEALDGVFNHHHHHHHHHHPHHGETVGNGYESLTRNNMSLNLSEAHDALTTLTSPDLQLLKLTSPELERLIIQSCNGLAPPAHTPNPTATPGGAPSAQARVLSAPKHARHGHECQQQQRHAFPMEEFECQQRMGSNPEAAVPGVPGVAMASSQVCTGFTEHTLNQGWDTYPDAPPPPPHPQCDGGAAAAHFTCAQVLKDEAQKVPETPPLSPIDMEDQERIKAERKRMRNRVAASKCRKRKLERLARLEERVNRLTGENGELRGAADTLRDQVSQIRHQLLDHIKCGCKVLSQQLQTVKEF